MTARHATAASSTRAKRSRACGASSSTPTKRQSRHRNPDQQAEQALCLTLVVNAIVVWNTVYAQLTIDQLRAEGHLATNTDLAGIGLYEHAHLHAYGDYPFDETARPTGYRPLRQPATVRRDAANRV